MDQDQLCAILDGQAELKALLEQLREDVKETREAVERLGASLPPQVCEEVRQLLGRPPPRPRVTRLPNGEEIPF